MGSKTESQTDKGGTGRERRETGQGRSRSSTESKTRKTFPPSPLPCPLSTPSSDDICMWRLVRSIGLAAAGVGRLGERQSEYITNGYALI